MGIINITRQVHYNEEESHIGPKGWYFSLKEICQTGGFLYGKNSEVGPFDSAMQATEACREEVRRCHRNDELDNLPEWKRIELLSLAKVSGLFGAGE